MSGLNGDNSLTMGAAWRPISRMSLMKLLCAVLIVVIHAKFTNAGHLGSVCINMGQEGVCRIAVPFFFFSAGYFMSRHMGERGWYLRELSKRIRSIFVPGMIFLVAYIAMAYSLNFVRGELRWCMADFGLDLRDTPSLVPVWFIRALMIIVAMSPILWRVFGKAQFKPALVSLGILACGVLIVRPYSDCGSSALYYFFNYGLSLEGVLYFSAGIFICRHSIPVPNKKVCLSLLILGILLFGLKFINLRLGYSALAFRLGFLAIPITLVGLYFVIPNITLPVFLHNVSFPIYMIHFFILSAIGGRYGVKGDWGIITYGGGLLLWSARIAVALVVPILFAHYVALYFPRLNAVLFGGRAAMKAVR